MRHCKRLFLVKSGYRWVVIGRLLWQVSVVPGTPLLASLILPDCLEEQMWAEMALPPPSRRLTSEGPDSSIWGVLSHQPPCERVVLKENVYNAYHTPET